MFFIPFYDKKWFISYIRIFVRYIFLNGSLNTVFYAIKETKDANNADPGIARMPPNSNYDTSTNNPFPNFHTILLTIPFVEPGGGYAVQIGVSIASQYNGKLAVRAKDSGNWQDWNVIS
jgi:hypothetical protein